MTGIDLTDIQGLSGKLHRSLCGILSGNFTGRGQLHDPGSIEMEGACRVVRGLVSFKEPVLGMDQLTFTEVSSRFHYGSGKIQIMDGKMKSRLLAAEFSGTVQWDTTVFNRSELSLQGTLIPRPEFLTALGEDVEVNLFRKQLREGGLPFTINGSLQNPGIIFKGLPQGLRKRLRVKGS